MLTRIYFLVPVPRLAAIIRPTWLQDQLIGSSVLVHSCVFFAVGFPRCKTDTVFWDSLPHYRQVRTVISLRDPQIIMCSNLYEYALVSFDA